VIVLLTVEVIVMHVISDCCDKCRRHRTYFWNQPKNNATHTQSTGIIILGTHA